MRSLAGIFALNLVFLAAGAGLLWGMRGWRAWSEFFRLAGVAYLLGVASVCVAATLTLVAGFGIGVPVVLGLSLALAGLGIAVGFRRMRPLPSWRLPQGRRERFILLGVAAAALTLVFLEAFFRVAHLQGVVGWDGWAFWTPKAESIYFFGGLDEQMFRSLPGPSYPLLVPALQAMDFHFMGSADTVTLAVQYWFLLVGFLLAIAGLLRPRVPLWLLWPFLGLMSIMPEFDKRLLNTQADLPLDYFFAVAALCLGLWLLDRRPWLLGAYTVFLAATMATKREGQLLTACLVVAGVMTTFRRRRAWLQIVGLAALAYAINIPWRVWWTSRGLTPDTPDVGVGRLSAHLDRVLPAFRIVFDLLFSYQMWLVSVPLALAAAVLLLSRRGDQLASFFLLTMGLGIVGFTWILWSIPSLQLNTSQGATPMPRAVGALVLLSCAFAPLLLQRLFEEPVPVVPAPA